MLEEGIAGVREIDLGLMMGTGMVPGPFARADFRGLDDVLAALERAEEEWGEHFAPPLVLRRLVAQGRLGAKSGQGFYPYPQPEAGYETAPVKLDRRGDDIAVLWLDNPPANSLSPAGDRGAGARRGTRSTARRGRSSSRRRTRRCSARAPTSRRSPRWTRPAAGTLLDRGHALLRSFERSRTMTIAAVNGMALGGGCELAMACDVRLAAFSASFGQPEINLGIIPGFGGTQRLPRLVGPAKALEMNTTGDPIAAEEAYEFGLVNRVVADHELFDTALAWARKFAHQAPLALEQIKRVSHQGDLDEGIEAEKDGFAAVVRLRGRARGHRRVPRQAHAEVQGRLSAPARRRRPAGRAAALGRPGRRADRRRASPSRPASRTSARPAPGCGRTSTRWRSRTSTSSGATRSASGTSTATASRRCATSSPTARTARSSSSSGAGIVEAVVTQNIDGLHRARRARAT